MKSSSKLPKCPKGWRIVRNGARIRKGDRFMAQIGKWSETSDAGRKIQHGQIPYYSEYPEYAGIYIRRKSVRPTTKQGGGK